MGCIDHIKKLVDWNIILANTRGVSRAAEPPPPPMSEKILRFPSRRR
jgi:hypothetical protein